MARFKPNRGFTGELERQGELREALRETAEPARRRVEQFARAVSPRPVMPKNRRRELAVIETDGPRVRVVLTGHGAHLVEWGSAKNPAYAPLRRGVRAAGFQLRDE